MCAPARHEARYREDSSLAKGRLSTPLSSLQSLEISDNGIELIGGKLRKRHFRPRLYRLRIGDPCRQAAAGERQGVRREAPAASDMRKIGSGPASRRRAGNLVAHDAGF